MANAQTLKITLLSAALFFINITHAFDERYSVNIDGGQILEEVREGSIERAAEIIWEHIKEEIIETLEDPEKVREIYAKIAIAVAEKLDEILNSGASPEEQADEIIALINQTLLEQKIHNAGDLGVDVEYSMDLLTHKLSWQRKVESETCTTGEWRISCNIDLNTGFQNCTQTWVVEYSTYHVEPDYKIYRVVDNQEKLITRIYGRSSKQSLLFGFSDEGVDWSGILESIKDGEDAIDPSIGVFYDFDADFRPSDTTLAYRIVADSNRFFGSVGNCSTAGTWNTSVAVDANADGFADFIPSSEIFKRYYAWLIPVTSMMLF